MSTFVATWNRINEETPGGDTDAAPGGLGGPPGLGGGGLGGPPGLGGGGLGGGLGGPPGLGGGGLGGGLGGPPGLGGGGGGGLPPEMKFVKIDDVWSALRDAVKKMDDYPELALKTSRTNKKERQEARRPKSIETGE